MGELMMVEKGGDTCAEIELPIFYMNDFSMLGLVVGKMSRAFSVLKANGFHIAHQKGCARISFNSRLELQKIFETLNRHQIPYGTADLVSQAYQG